MLRGAEERGREGRTVGADVEHGEEVESNVTGGAAARRSISPWSRSERCTWTATPTIDTFRTSRNEPMSVWCDVCVSTKPPDVTVTTTMSLPTMLIWLCDSFKYGRVLVTRLRYASARKVLIIMRSLVLLGATTSSSPVMLRRFISSMVSNQ